MKVQIHNMGTGPALNIHCVLYGSEGQYIKQFVSWNNGPIEGNGKNEFIYDHSHELCLNPHDTVDGTNPLYLYVPNAPINPIARLTITYHDLFEIKHVSIFDHTLEHRWVHVAIDKIPVHKKKPALDLKEMNVQKKQQAVKYSAPPARTSI